MMRPELLGHKETLTKTPDSICIFAPLATIGSLGDIVVLSTVAARLNRAGISRVGLGYNKESAYHVQVTQIIPPGTVEFRPLPKGLFNPELALPDRLWGILYSWSLQAALWNYDRLAFFGAKDARFFKKSFLRDRLDFFPQDIYPKDQPIVDYYTFELGKHYGIASRVDQGPVGFSIPTEHEVASKQWAEAQKNKLDLESPYWVVNLSTGEQERNWPLERFIPLSKELYQKTKAPIVLINPPGGARERSFLATELEECPWVHFFDSAWIAQTAHLIKHATGYIGGDTGLTHIAAALEIPLVALFLKKHLPMWRPVTKGQPMIIISGVAMERISYEQVMEKLEAHPDFFQSLNS